MNSPFVLPGMVDLADSRDFREHPEQGVEKDGGPDHSVATLLILGILGDALNRGWCRWGRNEIPWLFWKLHLFGLVNEEESINPYTGWGIDTLH